MSKKYKYIYKTINLINNKIYIGQHVTNKINDRYLGSGEILKKAISKYGKENFKKEIIVFCETYELLNKIERLIVDEDFVKRDNTYNLTLGGFNSSLSQNIKNKISEANLGENNGMYNKTYVHKDENYKLINSDNLNKWLKRGWNKGCPEYWGNSGEDNGMYNKTHDDKVKNIISNVHKDTKYMCKNDKTIKVNPNEVDKYKSNGWKPGRSFDTGKGYKFLHKGKKEIKVPQDKINKYTDRGWKLGRKEEMGYKGKDNPMYNKMIIYKEGETKRIDKSNVEYYKNKGWKGGSHDVSDKNNPKYNRVKISKNNESKYVNINNATKYINNGWNLAGNTYTIAIKNNKKKIIRKENDKKYILNDWIVYNNFNTKLLNKNGKRKKVKPVNLKKYINNGWKIGK